jgi:hypothetical protein
VPDQVINLTCIIKRQENNPNSLDTELSWGLPCSLRGLLHFFEVSVFGTRSGLENHTIIDVVNVTEDFRRNDIFRINFGELKPLYNYKFEVSATLRGSTESGEINDLTVLYPAGSKDLL